ncbi:unnamed protein product [Caenorhabditis brenneri]
MQVDKFPLRRLPNDVSKNVLRTMDGDELISYSLISRATKQNVIDLTIKLSFFSVSVSSKLEIDLATPEYYEITLIFDENKTVNWNPEENEPLRLDSPRIVEVKCRENYFHGYKESLFLENRGISVREWILHLFDIFHYPIINQLHLSEETNHFDIDFIRRMVEGLTVKVAVSHGLPLDNCYKLMMGINKLTKKVIINSDLKPVEYLHKMVIQNTENTMFHSRFLHLEERTPLRINDVLANNSENIDMGSSVSSAKDLNCFLKLWINGSNPQLKYLGLGYERDQRNERAMEGIRYRVMKPDEQRQRPHHSKSNMPDIVAGAGSFLIRRKNGVEATVSFRRGMQFVVWN